MVSTINSLILNNCATTLARGIKCNATSEVLDQTGVIVGSTNLADNLDWSPYDKITVSDNSSVCDGYCADNGYATSDVYIDHNGSINIAGINASPADCTIIPDTDLFRTEIETMRRFWEAEGNTVEEKINECVGDGRRIKRYKLKHK